MNKPSDDPAVKSRLQYLSVSMMADEREEFVVLDDGFVYYWPNNKNIKQRDGVTVSSVGAFSASTLRALADELDRRNAAWQEVVDSAPELK